MAPRRKGRGRKRAAETNAKPTPKEVAEAAAVLDGISDKGKDILKAVGAIDVKGEEEVLTEEWKEKVEAAKVKTLDTLEMVRGTLDGLNNYQLQLHKMMDDQLMLEEQMIEAIENTRRARARIREEQERVAALRAQTDLMMPEYAGDGRRV